MAILINNNKSMFRKQPKEINEGNREYKRYLLNADKLKIEKRATQMLFRLIEGESKALYLLGIEDDGTVRGLTKIELEITLTNIEKIAKSINAEIKKIRIYVGGLGNVATVRIILPSDEYNKILDNYYW